MALAREPIPKPKKRKGLRKRNRKRAEKLFDRNYGVGGRRGEAVRSMGCFVARTHGSSLWLATGLPSCDGPMEAAHDDARGAGGVHGDATSLLCLCKGHHAELGRIGKPAFDAKYEVDITAEAERVRLELDERFGPEPCYRCGETSGHTLLCSTAEGRRAARKDD